MSGAPETVMADAFRRAGVKTPRDRIDDMLRRAIDKADRVPARAVAELARLLLASSVPVVWEFFSPDRNVRLWKEVEGMFATIRREQGLDDPPRAAAGQRNGGQIAGADKARTDAPPSAGSGQNAGALAGQVIAAAPAPLSPATPRRINQIAADSYMRRVMVAGRPVGEATGDLARQWATARSREARFVKLLAEGVPDGSVIADCKTEADAVEAYRLAMETNDAT